MLTPVITNTSQNWVKEYFKFNIKQFEYYLETKREDYWQSLGEKQALNLFKKVSKNIPAYKDFLKKRKINPDKIKTIEDFSLIEPTDKINYILQYPLSFRCWQGKMPSNKIIASSSGTTGEPNYWPRSNQQEFEATITHELLFRKLFQIHKQSTLAIIGFPMGVYVSGIATTIPAWLVSQKYNLTLLTAGNNKTEVLKAIKTLSKNFDQTLLIGHPFFIKDILETGSNQNLAWNAKKIKMMFCSEGFNEHWRDYIIKKAGLNSKNTQAFNTYGSSELLLMAYETKMSIMAKQLMEKRLELAKKLIGSPAVGNLFQYNPLLRFVQQEKSELLFTADSGIPLVRFNLHDSGSVISYQTIAKELPLYAQKESWQLPFLSLKGRSDYTVIFYAANIYPQHIHSALSHRNLLKKITGKFTMVKGYRHNMDEFLEINIELRTKIKTSPQLAVIIKERVFNSLKEINSEFSDAFNRFGTKVIPRIKLFQYQDPLYFKPGIKPKYIQND